MIERLSSAEYFRIIDKRAVTKVAPFLKYPENFQYGPWGITPRGRTPRQEIKLLKANGWRWHNKGYWYKHD